ncbi:hypothetical protein P9112_010427 [Eukaryota sp. TZLM1-RC]
MSSVLQALSDDLNHLREEAVTVLTSGLRLSHASFPRIAPYPLPSLSSSTNIIHALDLNPPLFIGIDHLTSKLPSPSSTRPLFVLRGPPRSGRSSLLTTGLPFALTYTTKHFPTLPSVVHLPFSNIKPRYTCSECLGEFFRLLKQYSTRYVVIDQDNDEMKLNETMMSPIRSKLAIKNDEVMSSFDSPAVAKIPWSERFNVPSSPYKASNFELSTSEQNFKKLDDTDELGDPIMSLSEQITKILKYLSLLKQYTGNLLITIDDFDLLFKNISDQKDKQIVLQAFGWIFSNSGVIFAISMFSHLIMDSPNDLSLLVQNKNVKIHIIDPIPLISELNYVMDDVFDCLDDVYNINQSKHLINLVCSYLPSNLQYLSIILPFFHKIVDLNINDKDFDYFFKQFINQEFSFVVSKNVHLIETQETKLIDFNQNLPILTWSFDFQRVFDGSLSFKNDLLRLCQLCFGKNQIQVNLTLNPIVDSTLVKIVNISKANSLYHLNRSIISDHFNNNDLDFDLSGLVKFLHSSINSINPSKMIKRGVYDYHYSDVCGLFLNSCNIKRPNLIDYKFIHENSRKLSNLIDNLIGNHFSSLNQLFSFVDVCESAITSSPAVSDRFVIIVSSDYDLPSLEAVKSFFIQTFKIKIFDLWQKSNQIFVLINTLQSCQVVIQKPVVVVKYEKVKLSVADSSTAKGCWEVYFSKRKGIESSNSTIDLLSSMS